MSSTREIAEPIGDPLPSRSRMDVAILRHSTTASQSSLGISLCSRCSSIRVKTRRITISNEDSRIGDVEVARSVAIALLGKVLHTLPETIAFACKTLIARADKVQIEGKVFVRIFVAVVGVFGTLLNGLVGSEGAGEVCSDRREVF